MGVPPPLAYPTRRDNSPVDTNSPSPPTLMIDDDLTTDKHRQLVDILNNFPNVLSEQPGHTDIAQNHIGVGSAEPVRLRLYRLSADQKHALQ